MLAWMCAAILTTALFIYRMGFEYFFRTCTMSYGPYLPVVLDKFFQTHLSVVYSMCSKLTYFHSQYVKLYQKAEEKELKRLIEEKESVHSVYRCI